MQRSFRAVVCASRGGGSTGGGAQRERAVTGVFGGGGVAGGADLVRSVRLRDDDGRRWRDGEPAGRPDLEKKEEG